MMKKASDEEEARALALEAKREERWKKTEALLSKPTPKPEKQAPPPKLTVPDLIPPGGEPPSSQQTGDTPTPGKGSSSAPQGLVSKQQGYQLLVDQGMDHNNATIGAAIMMGESSGKPGALNDNGEYSLGLWQHNRDTGEDRRSFYGISDWSELSDPVTNARATYRLWKRAGGQWTDWGAYTNGSYKKYL